MKVALDISRMHDLSLERGIGVYAKNLYHALKQHTDLEVDLVREKVNLQKYDLVHQPFFDFYRRSILTNLPVPLIVTIHDLIPLMFKAHYPSGIKGKINWHFQNSGLKKTSKIISVSEIVKNDIERILKINSEKISAIYSAPSEEFQKINDQAILFKTMEKYNLPDKFVLYIGNINWNKNIISTTQAVLDSGQKFVIIGSSFLDKASLNHPEKKTFKKWLEKYNGNKNIILMGSLSQSDVIKVMNLAKCLVFASYYEGFGLPILEAQRCGLPVITSNISATKEISGSGAILINPESIDEISGAIKRLFISDDLRKELIKKGSENAEKFSWVKTAKETAKIYKNALT